MNGVSRFLSRRDKKNRGSTGEKHQHHVSKDLYKIFHPEEGKKVKDKEEEKKIKLILARLETVGITDLKDGNVEYALRSKSTDGDVDNAYDLLLLFEDALHGTIREYNKDTKLLGAENRELVTCYLDSLLFAMFARLDSFESMVSVEFHDPPRKRLVTILRLWVNLLRSGKLITTDITKHLQEALSSCGWEEAAKLRQQDVSEAFSFITGKLDLPLLTLKMDVYHTGKEDEDDHKIVKERLLDVALPPPPENGSEIKLEDCLEAYFNNRIEVKRHLQRRNTLQSMRPSDQKGQIFHLETVELNSPGAATPKSERLPPFSPSLGSPVRPSLSSHGRADSIFNKKIIEIGEPSSKDDIAIHKRARAPTVKREVLMPAWQFFSLIPWYTQTSQGQPSNDVQVAQHFSSKRPVLGICLKRYSMTAQGVSSRLDTYIDIPLEIGLPHFISDDSTDDFGSHFTNFKLSLQSVICHRGNSLDSGHYIALVRGDASNAVLLTEEPQPTHPANPQPPFPQSKPPPSPQQPAQNPPTEPQPQLPLSDQQPADAAEPGQTSVPGEAQQPGNTTADQSTTPGSASANEAQPISAPQEEDKPPAHDDHSHNRMPSAPWMRFDDLAKERVTYVDIRKALHEECPYLLFYQVVPIDETFLHGEPPSYESIINGEADRLENSTNNVNDADTSESTSVAASTGVPSIFDPSIVSLSTANEFENRSSTASDLSNVTDATDATSSTLKPLPSSPGTLHKSQSVNIASLKHHTDFPMGRTKAADHASLLSGGVTMRPHSIDLSTLAARTAAASAMATAGSLEPPQERNSMSSMERSSINFPDSDQRSSIYTASAKGVSSAPITPGDEHDIKGGFLGISRSRRSSANVSSGKSSWRKSRSRPPSQSGEGRLSLNLSSMGMGALSMGRLKAAVSKDKLSAEKDEDSGGHSDDGAKTGSVDKHKHSSVKRGKSLRHGKKPKSRSASIARLEGDKDAERPERECTVM